MHRTRFGIEASYRQLHEARIKTCTRDPRLLFVGIALVLRNVWVRAPVVRILGATTVWQSKNVLFTISTVSSNRFFDVRKRFKEITDF